MLAACGVHVPMIAGRGLAHTGGTIDKLEAILDIKQACLLSPIFSALLKRMVTPLFVKPNDLAPADRRMYATRDVTATVEHLGLITASIVSKKLAAGLEHLVLDVKCGNGAVMQDVESAPRLAESMVAVGNGAGMKTSALLTTCRFLWRGQLEMPSRCVKLLTISGILRPVTLASTRWFCDWALNSRSNLADARQQDDARQS